jgi:sec-independent protein translocase protein TatA
MLSVPHMIVVFLVVLVVFGPQKLPELARSFGKLMAEFRKASNDFKNAFEEEMRDLERQARIAELKKQVAEANAAADAATQSIGQPALPAPSPATSQLAETASRSSEGPVITPVAEAVSRLDGANGEAQAAEAHTANTEQEKAEPATENPSAHDQQQPA